MSSPLPSTASRRLFRVSMATALAVALSAALSAGAAAAPSAPRSPSAPGRGVSDVTPVERHSTARLGTLRAKRTTSHAQVAGVTPAVGTSRQFLGLDDYNGTLYRKNYTLQAVGSHVEVWVADDTAFPTGDCRAAVAGSTTVTRAQAEAMAREFDATIYPSESAAFSVPPERDGSNAILGPDGNGNGGDYTGDGAKVVTLVDNIRDDNYYTFPAATSFNPGFFNLQFNELFDRNVITLDAYDWVHRTTANPPDATSTDVCTSRPARPRFYEATFAHEYHQLLHSYTDPQEATWLDEGLSAYAESLTGYANAKKTVLEAGADTRILCYQGFGNVKGRGNPQPQDCGGPENSLTGWGDQGSGAQLLADQGQVWSFILYLKDRFGAPFVRALHNDGDAQGLAGVQRALDLSAAGTKAQDVVHDFQVASLLDVVVDRSSAEVRGIPKARVVSASLNSTVNVANPRAYAADGVPPNGADYVALRDAGNRYLSGSNLTSLAFVGDRTLAPRPLQWTTVSNDPDRPGDPVLFSGNSNDLDAYALTRVTVPTADPTLRFLASYGAELGYDFAYTVISTDGGLTYTALPGDKTVDGPLGPALNGTTDGYEPHTFDLSAYAGQSVLLGFRYVSDGGVNEGGWRVDDVTLGATRISDGSSTTGFLSDTQARPVPVAWHVRLVGIDPLRPRALVQTYDSRSFTRSRSELAAFKDYPLVVAVVSHDPTPSRFEESANYRLTVNGARQPGGGPATG